MECTEFEYLKMEFPSEECRFLCIDLSSQAVATIKEDIKRMPRVTNSSYVLYGSSKKSPEDDSDSEQEKKPTDDFRELDEYQGLPIHQIDWDSVDFEEVELHGYNPAPNDKGWFSFPEHMVKNAGISEIPNVGMLIENLDDYVGQGKYVFMIEITKASQELEKRKPHIFDAIKQRYADQIKQNHQSQPTLSQMAPSSKQVLSVSTSSSSYLNSGLSNLTTPAASITPAPIQQSKVIASVAAPNPAPTFSGLIMSRLEQITAEQLEDELSDITEPISVPTHSINIQVAADSSHFQDERTVENARVKVKPNQPTVDFLAPQRAGHAIASVLF